MPPPLAPTVRWLLPALLLSAPVGCGAASGEDGSGAPETAETAQQVPTSREAPPRNRAIPLPGTAWVVFGADTIVAEVARTAEERARGLMYREEVPEGTGMIFVFGDSAIRSFWMQNTYVPLDIAYLHGSFRIVDIQTMRPGTTERYESAAPAMFALEVRAGWFADRGIGVGDTAEIIFGG